MVPAPNPGVAELATVWVAVANAPVAASMLASVGAGPRWNGLAACVWVVGRATAAGSPAVTEAPTAATPNTATTASRRSRYLELRNLDPPCASCFAIRWRRAL